MDTTRRIKRAFGGPVTSGPGGVRRPIPALSIDARLADTVPAAGWVAHVHSRHDRVVNLLSSEGQLWCVATAAIEDAPLTVRVADVTWQTLDWRVGDRVTLCAHESCRCRAGVPIAIGFGHADRWRPVLADFAAVHGARLDAAVEAIDRHLSRRQRYSAFERVVADEVSRRVDLLLHAVRAGEVPAIAAAAENLMGLGAGLTPTGDDVLTGLGVLAGSRGTHLESVRPALRRAIGDRRSLTVRTTAVSAAVLQEAAEGRGRQRLHDLLAAITRTASPQAAGRPALEEAIGRVIAIGHSSGADILTGVRLGLVAEADLRATHDLARGTVPTRRLEEGITR